jgi:hypothetical protein
MAQTKGKLRGEPAVKPILEVVPRFEGGVRDRAAMPVINSASEEKAKEAGHKCSEPRNSNKKNLTSLPGGPSKREKEANRTYQLVRREHLEGPNSSDPSVPIAGLGNDEDVTVL